MVINNDKFLEDYFSGQFTEVADPTGRYKDWFIEISEKNNKASLEIIDQLCETIFVKYKLHELEKSVILERSNPAYGFSYTVVGRTSKRKRETTLQNDIKKIFYLIAAEYENNDIGTYRCDIFKLKIPYEYVNIGPFLVTEKDSEYKGDDIRLLDDRKSRYPWQNTLLDLFYDEEKELFKRPDDRKIYWIQDKVGATGKSKFVKWIYVNRPDEVVKITYGSPSQLKTSLINIGPKKLYFLDLPRTKGKDEDIANLMAVVEDLKNGHIVSNMYGRGLSLMMDSPHVVIFTNADCPRKKLSLDRWKVFQIDSSTLKLKKV
jgi:hypothetical protein